MKPDLGELLEDGDYRLRIDGQVYAPVDKSALVALLECGALIGHEELAEQDGPWMSVRTHPVLSRLRATMVRELHQICDELVLAPSGDGSAHEPPRTLDLRMLLENALAVALVLALSVLFALFALIISRAYF